MLFSAGAGRRVAADFKTMVSSRPVMAPGELLTVAGFVATVSVWGTKQSVYIEVSVKDVECIVLQRVA